MKNKCKIGMELGTGRVKWITCIKDGIATKLGKLLLRYYNSTIAVNNLLKDGAVWSITENTEATEPFAEVTRVKVEGMPLASEPARIEPSAHVYEKSITLDTNDIYECYYLFTKKGQWQITFRTRPNQKVKAKYTTENLAEFLVALEKMFADRERAKEFKKQMKAKKRAEREQAVANQDVAQEEQSVVQVADASEKMVEAKQLAPETNKLQALFMA
jgi:hypothetical protein